MSNKVGTLPVVHASVDGMLVIVRVSIRLGFYSLLFWRIRSYMCGLLLIGG